MFKSLKKAFGRPAEERAQLLLIDYLENLKGSLAGRALADVVAANVEKAGEDAALAGVGADTQFEFSHTFSLFAGGLAPAFVGAVLPEAGDDRNLSYAGTPLTAVFGIEPEGAVEMILAALDVMPEATDMADMPADADAYEALSNDERLSWQIFAAVQFAAGRLAAAFEAGKVDYAPDEEEVDNLANVMSASVVT